MQNRPVTELCPDGDTGVDQYPDIGRALREIWSQGPQCGWGTGGITGGGCYARGLTQIQVCLSTPLCWGLLPGQ